ncbi:hypothetical protein VHA01S_046_00410 [Vibrio halioticoli NBRC 102217]|uniref:DNA-3-methyladenine glycosylase AlkA N-terminal domain-containing protein n=1 Tax=Vibrio halioticoli NBRC 102217 TaxID=1219072 RepID=V5FLJ5_9VIBR|nr:AlkA N-terminal domain-containing protein [Vibrio halioticoli]GAD90531.1 hypothetical protein VHA01S_046_00410 [Vibrio halioticoli NBRC 102217]
MMVIQSDSITPNIIEPNPIETNTIELNYKGALDWQYMLDFYQRRAISHLERIDNLQYTRHAQIDKMPIWFRLSKNHPQSLTLEYQLSSDSQLNPLINAVRRMFDLDSDLEAIQKHLHALSPTLIKRAGIRIPGVWSTWEAGVRAVLGQQISVTAAINHLNHFTKQLTNHQHFPSPQQVATADLSFLKMPQRRKETLNRLAEFIIESPQAHPSQWLAIKGIGPWTIQYAQLRGLSEKNCFLSNDLVVKKALAKFPHLTADNVSPYGSYATFHLWNQ